MSDEDGERYERLDEVRKRQASNPDRDRYADEAENLADQIHALRNLLQARPSFREVDARIDRAIDGATSNGSDEMHKALTELGERLSKHISDDLGSEKHSHPWTTTLLLVTMGLLTLFTVLTLMDVQQHTDARFTNAVLTACEQRQELERVLHGIVLQSVSAPRGDESQTEFETRREQMTGVADSLLSPPCPTLLGRGG